MQCPVTIPREGAGSRFQRLFWNREIRGRGFDLSCGRYSGALAFSGKELPPLSMLYLNQKMFCRPRKGLGTSLAQHCCPGLVGSGFPCKFAEEMATRDNAKLFILYILLFTPTRQDCALRVVHPTNGLQQL